MTIFVIGFWIITILCVILFLLTNESHSCTKSDQNFNSFQYIYLGVYLLATASDWIQGPYIYALYKHYGFSSHEIDILFVAGYGSSMVFGTFVGSLADRFGRKRNCLLYALLYSLSCITKHFPNFAILFVGRLISGVATSILCSAFEAWLICEHNRKNFSSSLLSLTFSRIVIGNSLVAIISGIVAQFSVDCFGYVTPYDIAVVILMIMSLCMSIMWTENFGDEKIDYFRSFANAFNAIKLDKKIQYLGLVQSLFEGSMYTFVLKWTPSLTLHPLHLNSDDNNHYLNTLSNSLKHYFKLPSDIATLNNSYEANGSTDKNNIINSFSLSQHFSTSDLMKNNNRINLYLNVGSNNFDLENADYNESHRGQIPHGFIFAAFMVSIMTGSLLFRVLSTYFKVESFLRFVLVMSASCLFIPIILPQSQSMIYISFILFELCVGIFWPSMAMLRGRYLPETNRAAIMSMFRVPLNLFVIIILIQDFSSSIVFSCCVTLLLVAAFYQSKLFRSVREMPVEILKSKLPT